MNLMFLPPIFLSDISGLLPVLPPMAVGCATHPIRLRETSSIVRFPQSCGMNEGSELRGVAQGLEPVRPPELRFRSVVRGSALLRRTGGIGVPDRKSTRLNSSHG